MWVLCLNSVRNLGYCRRDNCGRLVSFHSRGFLSEVLAMCNFVAMCNVTLHAAT
jgi:hypothetical protein